VINNFPEIKDPILRTNLNITFNHILVLSTLLLKKDFDDSLITLSSFRKTIIIHTASIIEALLMIIVKYEVNSGNIKTKDSWKYTDIRMLYKISPNKQVVGLIREQMPIDINKLDFNRVIDYCSKYHIIEPELESNLDRVRSFRNRLHIGNLKRIDKLYNDQDLEFVFDVAKDVKSIISSNKNYQ